MLTAVRLEDKPLFITNKIDNIVIYRRLPSESQAIQLIHPDTAPRRWGSFLVPATVLLSQPLTAPPIPAFPREGGRSKSKPVKV